MICKLCKERGKTWVGDNPKCAFESGSFSSDNWNCATANRIRNMCHDHMCCRNDDESACLISGGDDFGFVLVCWYKRRGRTDAISVIGFDGEYRPITIEEAQSIIEARQ